MLITSNRPFNSEFDQKHFKLNVPYALKDQAKNLGAWWDSSARYWFLPEDSPQSTLDTARAIGFAPETTVYLDEQSIRSKLRSLMAAQTISNKDKDFLVEAICLGFGPGPSTYASLAFSEQGHTCALCNKSKGELLSWSTAKKRWSFAAYAFGYSMDTVICSKCSYVTRTAAKSLGLDQADSIDFQDWKGLIDMNEEGEAYISSERLNHYLAFKRVK